MGGLFRRVGRDRGSFLSLDSHVRSPARTEFIKKERELQLEHEKIPREFRVNLKKIVVLPPHVTSFDPR